MQDLAPQLLLEAVGEVALDLVSHHQRMYDQVVVVLQRGGHRVGTCGLTGHHLYQRQQIHRVERVADEQSLRATTSYPRASTRTAHPEPMTPVPTNPMVFAVIAEALLSPKDPDGKLLERGILGHQHKRFQLRLGSQYPVERIPVLGGIAASAQPVLVSDREMAHRRVYCELIESQHGTFVFRQSAEPEFSGDFPRAGRTDEDIIFGIGDHLPN